jgi:hypothetical protein
MKGLIIGPWSALIYNEDQLPGLIDAADDFIELRFVPGNYTADGTIIPDLFP